MTVWDSALSLRALEGRTGDSNNPWKALIENNFINSWRGLLTSEHETGYDYCRAECRGRIKRFWTVRTSRKIETKCEFRSSELKFGQNSQKEGFGPDWRRYDRDAVSV